MLKKIITLILLLLITTQTFSLPILEDVYYTQYKSTTLFGNESIKKSYLESYGTMNSTQTIYANPTDTITYTDDWTIHNAPVRYTYLPRKKALTTEIDPFIDQQTEYDYSEIRGYRYNTRIARELQSQTIISQTTWNPTIKQVINPNIQLPTETGNQIIKTVNITNSCENGLWNTKSTTAYKIFRDDGNKIYELNLNKNMNYKLTPFDSKSVSISWEYTEDTINKFIDLNLPLPEVPSPFMDVIIYININPSYEYYLPIDNDLNLNNLINPDEFNITGPNYEECIILSYQDINIEFTSESGLDLTVPHTMGEIEDCGDYCSRIPITLNGLNKPYGWFNTKNDLIEFMKTDQWQTDDFRIISPGEAIYEYFSFTDGTDLPYQSTQDYWNNKLNLNSIQFARGITNRFYDYIREQTTEPGLTVGRTTVSGSMLYPHYELEGKQSPFSDMNLPLYGDGLISSLQFLVQNTNPIEISTIFNDGNEDLSLAVSPIIRFGPMEKLYLPLSRFLRQYKLYDKSPYFIYVELAGHDKEFGIFPNLEYLNNIDDFNINLFHTGILRDMNIQNGKINVELRQNNAGLYFESPREGLDLGPYDPKTKEPRLIEKIWNTDVFEIEEELKPLGYYWLASAEFGKLMPVPSLLNYPITYNYTVKLGPKFSWYNDLISFSEAVGAEEISDDEKTKKIYDYLIKNIGDYHPKFDREEMLVKLDYLEDYTGKTLSPEIIETLNTTEDVIEILKYADEFIQTMNLGDALFILENKVGVCRHRADLLAIMLERAGIDTKLILVGGVHAYNLATIDGDKYYLDPRTYRNYKKIPFDKVKLVKKYNYSGGRIPLRKSAKTFIVDVDGRNPIPLDLNEYYDYSDLVDTNESVHTSQQNLNNEQIINFSNSLNKKTLSFSDMTDESFDHTGEYNFFSGLKVNLVNSTIYEDTYAKSKFYYDDGVNFTIVNYSLLAPSNYGYSKESNYFFKDNGEYINIIKKLNNGFVKIITTDSASNILSFIDSFEEDLTINPTKQIENIYCPDQNITLENFESKEYIWPTITNPESQTILCPTKYSALKYEDCKSNELLMDSQCILKTYLDEENKMKIDDYLDHPNGYAVGEYLNYEATQKYLQDQNIYNLIDQAVFEKYMTDTNNLQIPLGTCPQNQGGIYYFTKINLKLKISYKTETHTNVYATIDEPNTEYTIKCVNENQIDVWNDFSTLYELAPNAIIMDNNQPTTFTLTNTTTKTRTIPIDQNISDIDLIIIDMQNDSQTTCLSKENSNIAKSLLITGIEETGTILEETTPYIWAPDGNNAYEGIINLDMNTFPDITYNNFMKYFVKVKPTNKLIEYTLDQNQITYVYQTTCTTQKERIGNDFFNGGNGTPKNPYQITNCEQKTNKDYFPGKNYIGGNDINCENYNPYTQIPNLCDQNTYQDYQVICSCEELNTIRNNLRGKYILGKDIDCSQTSTWNSNKGFEPIGCWNNPDCSSKGRVGYQSFSGELNGNKYTISNLTTNWGVPYSGIIGFASGAKIHQLNVKNLTTSPDTYSYKGGLISQALDSIIEYNTSNTRIIAHNSNNLAKQNQKTNN